MKLNTKLIALHLIILGAWGCFFFGMMKGMMDNNRRDFDPFQHYVKLMIPALNNSSARNLFEPEQDVDERKKKRLYSKIYSRVSLKVDEDKFVRTKGGVASAKEHVHWLLGILFKPSKSKARKRA